MMEYQLVTFSDGNTALISSVPGQISIGVVHEGVHEVSRQQLSGMTQEEFDILAQQASDHVLRYDEAMQRIVATPKG